MRRIPRRVALWGGAAAIAGGGFAFMANNAVSASDAGEGVGAVTGYKVSAITYNDTCNGVAPNQVCSTNTFTFQLKPTVWNGGSPKEVAVTVFGTPTTPNVVLAKVTHLTGITTGGTLTVTLKTTTKPTSTRYFQVHVITSSPVLLHTITGLDVAASDNST